MRTPFASRAASRRSLRWLPLSGLALGTLACAGNVEVGEAKPDEEQHVDQGADDNEQKTDDGVDEPKRPVEEPQATSEPPEEVDCSEEDQEARAPYEAWQELENDFGVLAGKTFSGYIEAGPDLRLTIAADHSAMLVVGEPAPAPEKDKGYLCATGFEDETFACEVAYSQPPADGGSYPLHGAALEDSRLQIPLQTSAPWDAWCALQDPIEQLPDERCFFTTALSAPFSTSVVDGCTLNHEPVDCGWLALTQGGICRCTSTECFAMIGEGELLDARLNEAGDELVGSFRGATVYLFLEEEPEED